MPRITPVNWKILENIFLKDGFSLYRMEGSHKVYIKKGIHRPVVIPVHKKDIDIDIIKSNMRTAGMSRDKYFQYLKECK